MGMATFQPMKNPITGYCPQCRAELVDVWRVEQTMIPASIPTHLPKHERVLYTRHRAWTTVKCPNGHEFKRSDGGLYGKDAEIN